MILYHGSFTFYSVSRRGSLVYWHLRSRVEIEYALFGFLFYLSVPIIVKLSISTYVDLGLVFFTTATLLLLIEWINSNHKIRYLLYAGICCGLAAGTKYNGLVTILLLPLLYPDSLHSNLRQENKAYEHQGPWLKPYILNTNHHVFLPMAY